MRRLSMLLLAAMLGGCASQPQPVAPPPLSDNARYGGSNAGALAFDPPVLAGQARMDLSRDPRQPAAFAGYEDTVTTYYDVQSVDRQGSDYSAYSEKFGVNYR